MPAFHRLRQADADDKTHASSGSHQHPELAQSVADIDQALQLLADAGIDTSNARVRKDVDDAIRKALSRYESSGDGWQAVHELKFFHPRSEVTRTLVSILQTNKDGASAAGTRKAVVEILGRYTTDEVTAAVKAAFATENDPVVRKAMEELLKNSVQPNNRPLT